jgi:type IV pilus assembly protein PilM
MQITRPTLWLSRPTFELPRPTLRLARPSLRLRRPTLQLTRQKRPEAIVGLEIAAGSVAATEMSINGTAVVRTAAIGPLDPGAFQEGEVADPEAVSETLKALFSDHKLAKRVRIGVGNQRLVVRTIRLPAIEDPKELEAAVRFQAQEQIPMPLEQAVLEYRVVGGVAAEEGARPQIDVVVIAARRDMVSALVEPVRRAGLEPVGVDLSAFGMIRALAASAPDVEVAPDGDGAGAARPNQAVLFCGLGDVMNIAVARGASCLFTRTSYAGLEPVVTRLVGVSGLTQEHAGLWLEHVGLEAPLESIEGDPGIVSEARAALQAGVATMVDELRLSLDYYRAQDGAVPIERMLLCGPGSMITGLSERMTERLGLSISSARPPALAGFDERTAARLTLSYGLALES